MAAWKTKRIHSEKQLRDLVSYDPETGDILTRPKKLGTTAWGGGGRWKYRVVYICGKQYLEHRLAWYLMTGDYPPADMAIDHINGDATDNRWSNLRLATPSQNQWNRTKVNRNNKTGLTGVYKWKGTWFSSFRKKYLGSFPTKEAAHEAYRKAALDAYGEFAPKRLR